MSGALSVVHTPYPAPLHRAEVKPRAQRVGFYQNLARRSMRQAGTLWTSARDRSTFVARRISQPDPSILFGASQKARRKAYRALQRRNHVEKIIGLLVVDRFALLRAPRLAPAELLRGPGQGAGRRTL